MRLAEAGVVGGEVPVRASEACTLWIWYSRYLHSSAWSWTSLVRPRVVLVCVMVVVDYFWV